METPLPEGKPQQTTAELASDRATVPNANNRSAGRTHGKSSEKDQAETEKLKSPLTGPARSASHRRGKRGGRD
ncbi:hypothetical protein ISN44_As08g039650 [Arabidopsis suecica]|uniref:Uncharacterized protein n=1 Tax=Arabidopsis suecica TaxID=45249 RepID=A0A8T2BEW1_ARASU|nr:hypothetical protein ISN44_As08g039650 [Arabidopsis suecica]